MRRYDLPAVIKLLEIHGGVSHHRSYAPASAVYVKFAKKIASEARLFVTVMSSRRLSSHQNRFLP
jgi:hypothetical protein